MPIVKITGQGLAAIAFSVALLWGFIIAENSLERQAYTERARVLRDVQFLQRHDRPGGAIDSATYRS
jgi:hypothetical protein